MVLQSILSQSFNAALGPMGAQHGLSHNLLDAPSMRVVTRPVSDARPRWYSNQSCPRASTLPLAYEALSTSLPNLLDALPCGTSPDRSLMPSQMASSNQSCPRASTLPGLWVSAHLPIYLFDALPCGCLPPSLCLPRWYFQSILSQSFNAAWPMGFSTLFHITFLMPIPCGCLPPSLCLPRLHFQSILSQSFFTACADGHQYVVIYLFDALPHTTHSGL